MRRFRRACGTREKYPLELSEIRRLRNEGRSMRGIATTLNTRGYRTRRGSEWRLESVARILGAGAL
jgi:hypothetical protein